MSVASVDSEAAIRSYLGPGVCLKTRVHTVIGKLGIGR